MSRLTISLVLALANSAWAQDLAPDRAIEIELKSTDPVLEGHGPSRSFEYDVTFDGTLHVWAASSDFDPVLRVTDPDGTLLAEDDDSGGGTTACVKLEVGRNELPRITVAAKGGSASGSFTLHSSESPESEGTRAASALARERLGEAQRLRDAKSLAAARDLLAKAVGDLLAVEGARTSARVATALDQLGSLSRELGALAAARDALAAGLGFRERALPDAHPDLQWSRVELSNVLFARGDLHGSRAIDERVLAVRERTLPDDHPDLQMSRANLAGTLATLGDLPAARALQEKVLEVRSRTLPAEHPDLLLAKGNLAVTLKKLGELSAARPLQEEVLAVYSRTLPDDHPELHAARANLAETLRILGQYASARRLLEQVLEVYALTLPEDHPRLQAARMNLAATLRPLGELSAARALQERVLDGYLRTLPDDHPDLQAARGNLANTLQMLGDLRGARTLQEQALDVCSRTLPDDHPDLQLVRGNFANVLLTLGDYSAARALHEKAVAVLSRHHPAEHPVLLRAQGNLASVLFAQGDWVAARSIQESVLEVCSRTLPDSHPDLQWARGNLANTLHTLGELVEARALEEKVLEVSARTLPADHPDLRLIRRALVWTCVRQGDRARLSLLLPELARSLRGSLASSQGASSREAWERGSSLSTDFSTLLSLSEHASGLEPTLLELIETGRAMALPGPLARNMAGPELEALAQELRALRGRLQDLVASAGSAGDGDARRAEAISTLVRRRDGVEASLRQALVDQRLVPPPIELGALARALPEHSAAVGLRRYKRWSFDTQDPSIPEMSQECLLAFVVTGSGALRRVELGPIERIAAAVGRWRVAVGKPVDRGLSKPEDSEGELAAGVALRSLVLDPLLAAAGEVEALHICLDDALHLVPLDSLPIGEALVGDRVRVLLEASFGRLLRRADPVEGEPSLLALGGADFNAETAPGATAAAASLVPSERPGPLGANLAPLAQTRAEAENLGELFRNVFEREPVLLTGKRSTKSAFVGESAKARFVHVATHGYFAPESVKSLADPDPGDSLFKRMTLEETVTGLAPMTLCGLALAGANRGADALGRVPGIITAEELAGLDLTRCELAVLSACETNVGITRAGQGIQSLQAALHAAGARTAITSLWKVDDEATRELFEDFYTRIWVKHEPKSEALWAAKMALRKKGRPTRDWAAWVLTGDSR